MGDGYRSDDDEVLSLLQNPRQRRQPQPAGSIQTRSRDVRHDRLDVPPQRLNELQESSRVP